MEISVGNKQKSVSQIPAKIRQAIWKRSGRMCEVRLRGCLYSATEIHHVLMRSRGGEHQQENLLAVCRFCHDQITLNKVGTESFRKHSWEK